MYAIFRGRSYKDSASTAIAAYFYSVETSTRLFTYEVQNMDQNTTTFSLHTWDMNQSDIPVEIYPTLQYIKYDLVDSAVNGNCISPISSSNPNTTATPCMTGTFYPNAFPPFNLTSSVPLNNTYNSAPSTRSLLNARKGEWFYDDEPTVILRLVDAVLNDLDDIVLRTALQNPIACTEMKVCVAGIDGRKGSKVGAEVMVPLGLLLMKHAEYVVECSKPRSSSDS